MRNIPDGSFVITDPSAAEPEPDPNLLDLGPLKVLTTPTMTGPAVRFRVLGQDGETFAAVETLTSALRFTRGLVQTDAGLLVLPLRFHGRDNGPTYLFPDARLDESAEGQDRDSHRRLRQRAGELFDSGAPVVAIVGTGAKGGAGTGEAMAVGEDERIDPDPVRPTDDTVDCEPFPDEAAR